MAANVHFSVTDYTTNEVIFEFSDSETVCDWILDELAPNTKTNKQWRIAMAMYDAVENDALTTELWKEAYEWLGLDFQMYMNIGLRL